MANVFENFFNRPKIYKPGQIWHINEISEDIVITEVNEFYLKMGIIRGMLLSRATHLNDGNDIKFKPAGELKKLYGLERVLLRITDGPVLTEELSYYKGEIPARVKSCINKSLKQRLNLNPVQEELSAELLEKLQPLRLRVLQKSEQYEYARKIMVLTVLNEINKKARRFNYRISASDESGLAESDEFWKKERDNRDRSICLLEDKNNILRISLIEGRIYFTAKSENFKNISDIKLIHGTKEIPAYEDYLVFGKEKRVFTSFTDEKKLSKGDWKLHLKIDGKDYSFEFKIN